MSAPHRSLRSSKLDAVLANYDVESLVTVDPVTIPDVPFNWKIMVENFMEMYHQSRLHHGIHDFAPSSAASYADYERATSRCSASARRSNPTADSTRR